VARTDIVLTVRYMPAPAAVGPRGIGRFIRYVQYRDVHADSRPVRDLDGLIRYVHHRDATSPPGRLFDATGPAGDEHRRALVRHVARSTQELQRGDRPGSTSSERAVYQFILSPRDATGLDLKRLARSAMSQLATDAGRAHMPPWIAGEHRNTAHPHVHIVLAARREQPSGDFRTLVINRPRLARMKEALRAEMTRQQGRHLALTRTAGPSCEAPSDLPSRINSSGHSLVETVAWAPLAHRRFRQQLQHNPAAKIAALAARTSRHHRQEAERLARTRGSVWDDDDRRARRLR
jgi:hypothetical protein